MQSKEIAEKLVANIAQELIGKETQILQTLACLLAGGHLLLEDVPGLGKTTLAKSLARSFNLPFKRIQCTPDIMPSDITGVSIYSPQTQQFEFIQGPVFANIVLADEINRTSPRTQSALLEAMGEGTVSVDRKTYRLQQPFFVIATQNPVEFSGTYPLPEAQMDRFMMRISLGYPDVSSEVKMLQTHRKVAEMPKAQVMLNAEQLIQLRQQAEQVDIAAETMQYITQLIAATREHPDLHLGASPRASLALMKAAQSMSLLLGHSHVMPQTIQNLAPSILSHRLLFKNRQISDTEQRQFFDRLLKSVKVPDNPMR